MKFALLLLVSIGACLAAPRPHRLQIKNPVKAQDENLLDEALELLAQLPLDDIDKVFTAHLNNDGAVAAAVNYLQSDDWKELVKTVIALPENQDLIVYLNKNGVPIEELLPLAQDAIDGLKTGVDADFSGSLVPFLGEEEAVIPVDKLVTWVNDKLQNDPVVQDFYVTISSEKGHNLVLEVIALDEAKKIDQSLRDFGLDVDGFRASYFHLFGWGDPPAPETKAAKKISPRSIMDDVMELVALLPLDEIEATFTKHLANDGAVALVVDYLQSDNWKTLVSTALAFPEAQDLVKVLTDDGLPIDEVLPMVEETIDGLKPGVDADSTGSLRPFLDEEEALIPIDKILAWAVDKLTTDPDMQDMFVAVSSEKTHGLVDKVLALAEAIDIEQVLTKLDVTVQVDLDTVYGFFGWGEAPKVPAEPKAAKKISPRSILDDVMELVALLPLDEIEATFTKHLANDGAVALVVDYLQSDNWKTLVSTALAFPEAQDLVKVLTDDGLPIDEVLPMVEETIDGLKPGVDADSTGSLRPFLDEEEALIPMDKILAFAVDKLTTDPDFQDMFVTISSEKTHGLVDKVLALAEAIDIEQVLTKLDVTVQVDLDTVYGFFGWGEAPKVPAEPKAAKKISPRGLLDTALQFVGLLPIDDIKVAFDNHLKNDGALATLVGHIQTEEFKDLVQKIAAYPAAQEFITYLEASGIPVEELVPVVVNVIDGLQPGVDADSTGSLRPFIDEEEAILPLDKIAAWAGDELATDPSFQDLYVHVSSEKIHKLVVEVIKLDQVKKIDQYLRDAGVAIDEFRVAYFAAFGWGLPPLIIPELPAKKISPRSLLDVVLKFVDRLDLEKIDDIFEQHLANDGALAEVVDYLQKDDWKNLVKTVVAIPEAQSLIDYLEDGGLPIEELYPTLQETIDGLKPGVDADASGSLEPFIQEEEAQIPVDDILALAVDEMANDPEFQDLYVKVSSEQTHKLVVQVLNLDESKHIIGILKDLDVDAVAVLDVIFGVFGWGPLDIN